MSVLTRIWNGIFSRRVDKALEQEMETHLSLLMEDARARGLNDKEAMAEARRRFGSHARHFESTRDADVSRWLDELGQDMRFALRQTRQPSSAWWTPS